MISVNRLSIEDARILIEGARVKADEIAVCLAVPHPPPTSIDQNSTISARILIG